MLPVFGRGKYVSVLRHGSYVDIISHVDYPGVPRGMIRLVPVQFNHGVMVEYWTPDGKLQGRHHLSYRELYLGHSERSETTERR